MEEKIVKKEYTVLNKNKKITRAIQDLVNNVLLKTNFKNENGLFGDIEILDFDLDRVYLIANDTEFTIRMWNIIEFPKEFEVTWTFFKDVTTEYGSYGEEISCGVSLVDISE